MGTRQQLANNLLGQSEIVADLHMHSTASDGCLSATEIVDAACSMGLECIAITDHDSLEGAKSVAGRACKGSLRVISGVEISTQTDGRDVHLLGYFFDLDDPALNQMFESNRESRVQRACAIADNMAADGYEVSGKAMLESGLTVNRTLLARMLVRLGHASSIDDAYDRLIGKTSKYYVENVRFSTVEAIRMLIDAGGYPFIAHPALYKVVDLIDGFAKEGLFGIEAFHTQQSREQSAVLVKTAAEAGLAVSGGSDWHGDDTHGSSLASAGLDSRQLREFLAACGQL